jgi:hypothetical protein
MTDIKKLKGNLKPMVVGHITVHQKTFQPSLALRIVLVDDYDGSVVKLQDDPFTIPMEYTDPKLLQKFIKDGSEEISFEYMKMDELMKLPTTYDPTGDLLKDAVSVIAGQQTFKPKSGTHTGQVLEKEIFEI